MKIKKTNAELKVVEIKEDEGLKLPNKAGSITIYDADLKKKIIAERFDKRYRNLVYLVMDLNNNDAADEEDAIVVRDKLAELKNILLNNYSKHITKSILNRYLKMILLLEEKIIIPERHRGR